jgi:hypothetical protein
MDAPRIDLTEPARNTWNRLGIGFLNKRSYSPFRQNAFRIGSDASVHPVGSLRPVFRGNKYCTND